MAHVTKGACRIRRLRPGFLRDELSSLWLATHMMDQDTRGNIGHLTNTGAPGPALHCGHATHRG